MDHNILRINAYTVIFIEMLEGEEELSKEDENELKSIDRTLKEILKWTRFANIAKLREVLQVELDSDEKKLAFENSDGVNGLKELSEISGAPQDTIYGWWQKWFRLGFVTESEARKGRMMKIVSLDDVGIKIPRKPSVTQIPQTTQLQQSETGQPTQTEKDNRESL
jgi:hypothetical protein